MIKLKDIKSICNKAVLYRGKRFYKYESEAITNVDVKGDMIRAKISDILDYNVKIITSTMKYECSCNYDGGGACKHIIATLLLVANMEKNNQKGEQAKDYYEDLKSNIKTVDRNYLEMFILNEAFLNDNLGDRAFSFFRSGESNQTVSFYKAKVNKFLNHLIKDYYIPVSRASELDTFINNIELLAKKGAVEEAIKYFQAVFEILEKKLRTLDDSYGVIQDAINSALDRYVEYSNKYYTEQDERNRIIQYLWEQFMKNTDICDYYTKSIQEFCDNKQDWEYYKEIISKYLPSLENNNISFVGKMIIEGYIDALIHLEEHDELIGVFDKFSTFSSSVFYEEIKYLWSIGQFDNVVYKFENYTQFLYPGIVNDIRLMISDYLYKTNKEKYLENLIAIYKYLPSYEKYKQIEKKSGDIWPNIKDELFILIKDSPDLIDENIKKGLMKDAFLKLTEIDNISLYNKYLEILAPLYPLEYFEHYRDAIVRNYKQIGVYDRKVYRKILIEIRNLSLIKATKDQYMELQKQLKEENKRRPAFLDEMKKILE